MSDSQDLIGTDVMYGRLTGLLFAVDRGFRFSEHVYELSQRGYFSPAEACSFGA